MIYLALFSVVAAVIAGGLLTFTVLDIQTGRKFDVVGAFLGVANLAFAVIIQIGLAA